MKQLWLIPALPLAGFLLNGLVALVASSMRAEKESGADHPGVPLPYAQRLFHGVVGVGSVGLAAVLSFAALVPYALGSMQVPEGLAPIVQKVYTWMAAGDYTVDVAFRLDTLSALMLSFVTLVGGRRPLLVPPHRLLLRQGLRRRGRQEGVHREPRRRLRNGPRHLRRVRDE